MCNLSVTYVYVNNKLVMLVPFHQGLRTLELCVDNLQPDFLYDHIQPVRAELFQVSQESCFILTCYSVVWTKYQSLQNSCLEWHVKHCTNHLCLSKMHAPLFQWFILLTFWHVLGTLENSSQSTWQHRPCCIQSLRQVWWRQQEDA